MPRKKKTTADENPSSVLISEKEVWDVLKFANAVYNGVYPNVFTPELVSARFKDVTLNPIVATSEKINTALEKPKENEENLIGYSEWMELNSMLYKRILLYFSGLMEFNWSYTAMGVKDASEYKSKKYKSDLRILEDFFDRFNPKEQFSIAIREMMRKETFFGVLRDEGEKFVIQELPRKYCKITGRFEYGLVFDFNAYWLIQPGVNLDMYPPIFKRIYKKAFLSDGTNEYNPASRIDNRTSSWVYWVQTRPKDGFVAFKLFQELATNVPFLAPFMPDAIMQPIIRSLQENSYIAEASKIVAGQVPFLKDTKASVKDSLALDPVTLGKFLALMRSSLPTAIKVLSAPLDDIQGVEFSGNTEIYDSYLGTAASSSGVNSRLIYSKDRQNVLETKLSMDIDINVLRPVYGVFSNMVEYWVNQRTKHYRFKIEFEDFNTSVDREERLNKAFKFAESGIILDQKLAHAYGMNVFDFRRQIDESIALGFLDKLNPIVKSSQMPADGGAGRPKSSDSSLSDSGSDTRDAGSNEEKEEE